MKRNVTIILLAALAVLGSLFTLLSSNMLFGDILNAGAGDMPGSFFVTLPALTFSAFFVAMSFYLLRTYIHQDCKKRYTRTYSFILMALGLLGVIGAILGGLIYYHSFVKPNPFPGYLIIFLILNLLQIGLGVYGFILSRKMEEDEGKVKITISYVFKTLGWFFFLCLSFNRLGTFLGSPSFIYWRNFYQTFPFYLFLLVPGFLCVIKAMKIFDLLPRKTLQILAIVAIGLDVVLVGYTAIIGWNDTTFISSLSQAMPLERMASKPLELPIHFLACLGAGIAILVQTKKPKEEK